MVIPRTGIAEYEKPIQQHSERSRMIPCLMMYMWYQANSVGAATKADSQ